MSSVPAVSLIALLQLVSAVDAEVAGGVLPVAGGTQNEAAVTGAVSPTVGVVEPSSRGDRFRSSYSPRAFWRFPNELKLARPAVLHQLELFGAPLLGKRTSFDATSTLTVGELDYTAVTQVFGDTQAVAPADPFVNIFALNARLSLNHQLSRRWSIRTELPWTYQTIGIDDDTFGGPQESMGVGVLQSAEHRLTRTDLLRLAVGTQLAFFPEVDQLSTELTLGWGKTVTRGVQGGVSAGVGRIEELDARGDADRAPAHYYGVGTAFISRERQRGVDSIQLGLDGRLDPFLLEIRPQASLTATTRQTLSPQVALVADVVTYAVAFVDPLETNPSESGFGTSASVFWDQNAVLWRGGIRAGFRTPHWENEFEVREVTGLVFIGAGWFPTRRYR